MDKVFAIELMREFVLNQFLPVALSVMGPVFHFFQHLLFCSNPAVMMKEYVLYSFNGIDLIVFSLMWHIDEAQLVLAILLFVFLVDFVELGSL
jgi:hypothetical protein